MDTKKLTTKTIPAIWDFCDSKTSWFKRLCIFIIYKTIVMLCFCHYNNKSLCIRIAFYVIINAKNIYYVKSRFNPSPYFQQRLHHSPFRDVLLQSLWAHQATSPWLRLLLRLRNKMAGVFFPFFLYEWTRAASPVALPSNFTLFFSLFL